MKRIKKITIRTVVDWSSPFDITQDKVFFNGTLKELEARIKETDKLKKIKNKNRYFGKLFEIQKKYRYEI